MTSIRVYELAKELKMDSAGLINKLEELDIIVKSHASTLTEEQAQKARDAILGPNPKEVVEQRVRPGVIRRRVMRPTKEEEERLAAQELEAEESAKSAEKAGMKKEVHYEPAASPKLVAVPSEEKPEVKLSPEVERELERRFDKKPRPLKKKPSIEEVGPPVKKSPATEKAAHQPGTPLGQPTAKASIRLKASYMKPLIRREQVELLQKGEEGKAEVAPSVVEKERSEEEKKRKKKKKAAKEEVPEELLPVKKVVKKGATRRREIITRQEFLETPEQKYRPMRRKKKAMPKKMMKKTIITTPKAQKRIIRITQTIQVGELARRMGIKSAELLKKLTDLGIVANIGQYLDLEEATLVAADYGYEVENVAVEEVSLLGEETDNPEDYVPRPPIVTVMGHVDHGKTTLLDTIRKANVVDTEKGGITQHIGAYTVKVDGKEICFIDTPGHEAFTAMRARGAKATDIVVLVVAADDGVMDRTREAINHAKAAEVPIVVAVNKIDKPEADPDRIKRQLADIGLAPEEWGGSTMFVNVSAKIGTGVSDLLDSILLQAEIMELKANPKISARGVVLETKIDRGHGPMATTLVQQGILHKGDIVIAGVYWGKTRLMLDADGKQVDEARPSLAVAIVGFSGVPSAGDTFNVVKDEKTAKQIVEFRLSKQREIEIGKTAPKISFDELYERLQSIPTKELNLVVKADVNGSVEAIVDSLKQINSEKCKLNVIHSATGPISQNDVMLATASGAQIIGFNVKPDPGAKKAAEQEKVDIRLYGIIYELLDDIKRMMEGKLEPEYVEQVIGHAEVRTIFEISRVGKIAGSYVVDGKVVRNAQSRVLRKGEEIWKGKISGLKRFKDDVREVAQANECGIKLEDFDELQEGDIIEAFILEEIKPSL